MFRTLIYPSSGACDYSVELQHGTKNNTTNVVIQQNCRKFLMMDILMSETYWAHKKWNKIASDIKLVFYSSPLSLFFIYKPPRFKYVKLSIVHMKFNLGTSPEGRRPKMFLNEVLRKILGPKGRESHPDDSHWLCGWSLWLISTGSGHVRHDEFELFHVSTHDHLR